MEKSDVSGERREQVRAMLEAAWRDEGFCVPNGSTYPFQWLWDSCFHALIWAELGDDRAVVELDSVLAHQERSGFVPHMTYWGAPDHDRAFWGRPLVSTITQPPMYGHAAAQLIRRGFAVSTQTLERAAHGLRHLLRDRERTPSGLVPVIHPWETGCDDSPRWDGWRRHDPSVKSWRDQKAEIVAVIAGGATPFRAGSIGFNALVAWNARELMSVGGGLAVVDDLAPDVEDIERVIRARWDQQRATWLDDDVLSPGEHAHGTRTADALLALLVDPRSEAFGQLVDEYAFGGRAGPAGVHRAEPSFDPSTYWRGGSWPQLSYLLWWAATAVNRVAIASGIACGLRFGADESQLSEYWDPTTGSGLGAQPQTWSGLAICVEPPPSKG